MVADKDDLRPTCFGLVDELSELPAFHHARLIDHEHIAAAQIVSVVPPTAGPGRQRTTLDAGTFLKPSAALPDSAAPDEPYNPAPPTPRAPPPPDDA